MRAAMLPASRVINGAMTGSSNLVNDKFCGAA
jgi:hypothetical protein